MSRIDVYLPAEPDTVPIRSGSGIVGTCTKGGVLVDFEGNVYAALSMVRFADRVHHAWSRHESRYPSVARALLRADALQHVGVYDPDLGVVALEPQSGQAVADVRRRLCDWLDVPDADLDQQLTTVGIGSHQRRRDLDALAASGPAGRLAAARLRR